MAKKRKPRDSAFPTSLPPETGMIDASWDDDVEISGSDDPEGMFDRVTAIPEMSAEEHARRMMAKIEADENGERPPESGLHERPTPHEYLSPPRVPVFDGSRVPALPREPPPPLPAKPRRALSESGLPLHGTRRRDPKGTDPPGIASGDIHRRRTKPEGRDTPVVERSDPIDYEPTFELADLDTGPSIEVGEADDAVDPSFELDLESGFQESARASDVGGEVAPMYADMKDRYAMGDFTGALVIAESILEVDAEDAEAARYAESCRNVLTQMYAARMGSLEQIVTVSIPADQIRWLSLDHRAGFLLSLVDGVSTVEEILDISGMTRLEALRIMYTLLEQRVISVAGLR